MPFRTRQPRTERRVRRVIGCTLAAALIATLFAPAAFAAPPGAPDAPTIVGGDAQITVTFVPPDDGGSPITDYTAHCTSSNGGPDGSATGATSPIVVGGVPNGLTYTCTVTATNADGTSPPSPPSNSVVPSTLPGVPAAPTVVGGNAEITVSFLSPADGGSPITDYTAHCTSSDGGPDASATGATSPIVVVGVPNGRTYTCTVTATNANGDGPPSPASNSVVPSTLPGAPAQPTVTSGATTISVAFDAPNDGGSPITSYTADCTSSNGGVSGSNTGAASPVVVGALTNGRTYTCTVFATNANGDGPASAASDTIVVSTVPDAPSLAIVTPGVDKITVTYVEPGNGGSPITSYTADCTSSDGGVPGSVTEPASPPFVTPLVVTDLTGGRTYTCTVVATNANGDSAPSPPSSQTVPLGVPAAPATPTVTPGNARITVAFIAPNNGGSPITGYTAQCISTNGGTPGTVSGATSPIIVTGLTNGSTYTCTVFATNANGAGPASPPSTATTLTNPPAAPAKPSVTPGDARLTVKFSAPSNGGSPITGYTASCSSSDGGVARSKTGIGSPIVVTSVTNGRNYTCAVRATNANGSSAWSLASAKVMPIKVAKGFRLVGGDGGVFTFGDAKWFGSAAGVSRSVVLDIISTPSGNGYWLVAADGGIFSYGDARFFGSTGGMRLNRPVVGMTPTPTGKGYWLVASDGGIFSYGDARFFGSTGSIQLVRPIVGMAATPTGGGYWLVASDGGLFAFGDARFFGSAAGRTSGAVGMATSLTGRGYWIAAANGAVFAFGDAAPLGSVPASSLRLPAVGIESTYSGKGYWVAAGDGGVFAFGDAPYIGWPGPLVLARTIRGLSR